MVKITIVGAGIAGMSIASQLPKGYEITIVARDLPGDPDSLGWASPWAGAVWMGMDGSPPREQKMQLDAFAHMWKLAMTNPESSVKRIEMHDLTDFKKPEDVWYYGKMPGFRVMSKEELPHGAVNGMCWGIKQFGDTNTLVDSSLRADIFRRVHENLPQAFPDTPSGFQVVRDIVGIRPQRKTGARVEKEILDGQTVIHAYGAPGGGYVYSYGIAREVAELVNDIQLKMPKAYL
ncbi:aromatic amino acid aminotransferase [Neofusicoccum parvum]|uniref:Aromatic amino acid aminotransferase n=1 Tax=Neofusicoccum parvum TaxID=310453 RepID=A0ACB5SMI3_9PEZI|nr:aromatic amino acid aminotransferase [Neofusicoccum parvum]